MTIPYQDLHPEVACPTCEGAGFFGDGPYVEFCAYCHGTGVMIDEGVWLEPGAEALGAGASERTASGEGSPAHLIRSW
jgi:DnaJ-class molecular chaperone